MPSSSSATATNVSLGAAGALLVVQLLTPADPMGRCLRFLKQLQSHERNLKSNSNVNQGIDRYNALHAAKDVSTRNAEYKTLVDSYYDLATLFYEWGWGECFHFAYRYSGESFHEAIRRHEYRLASKLNLVVSSTDDKKKKKVLDVGCGIGGPMRHITRFLQHDVTGLTLNQYQVNRGNELCAASSLVKDDCRLVQGDFMQMPFEDDSFDGSYAIEATCHAPNRMGVYSEIYRVLKPGSYFCCYEWCMTDLYEKGNPQHEKIKKQIEEGDGLPDIAHTSVCTTALKEAGFELLEARDLALDDIGPNGKVWYLPLMPSWNPFTQRFQFNWLGHQLTNAMVYLLECLCLAPKGTIKTQRMLQEGGFGCSGGGKTGIFTPMYLMVGRVPLEKKVNPLKAGQ